MRLELRDADLPRADGFTGAALLEKFQRVRRLTEALCTPLATEDYVVQSMPDASPAKWHLAHTTWFFETFVLAPALPGYQPFDPAYSYLFNSYYNAVGERVARDQRGLLSRPTVADVYRYRAHVDEQLGRWLREGTVRTWGPAIVLGLNHEQQHQELLLTDIKHLFAANPLRPAYRDTTVRKTDTPTSMGWTTHAAGVRAIGHDGEGFAFDNESPRHRVFLEPFQLADRLVTNAEYVAFIEDDGYRRPQHWLSDGWKAVAAQGWQAPLYWLREGNRWWHMTLAGFQPVEPAAPVCHVSYYEADAFARWAGARLPTEFEWEAAAGRQPVTGNFLEDGLLQPSEASATVDGQLRQLFGDVWEWTASAYASYPGYAPPAGALGEYNGKFMCNQLVLRGGSCVTPRDHIRPTYRNFFPPETRWQFSGFRLARGN